MIAGLIPLLFRFLPYIAAVLALAAGWAYANHACWSAACHKYRDKAEQVQAEFSDYKAKEAAIVAGLAAAWDKKRQEAEGLAQQLEVQRGKTFEALRERAKAAAVGGAHFSGVAVRLFDDAARAAAETTGPAGKPEQALAAPAASAEEFVVAAYEWMGECKARVEGWARWYHALQNGVE